MATPTKSTKAGNTGAAKTPATPATKQTTTGTASVTVGNSAAGANTAGATAAQQPAATSQPPATPSTSPQPSESLAKQGQENPAGTTALAVVDLAADAAEFHDHFDRRSLQMPFLLIIQPGSPQVKPGTMGYVEGVQVSQFFHTVTKDSYESMKTGLEVVPVYHYATYIEWVIREAGGGFVFDHGLVEGGKFLRTCEKDEKNRDILPNGNQLVLTETYFLMLILEDAEGRVILDPADTQVMFPLTSTQLKVARNWNSRLLNNKVHLGQGKKTTAPMFFNTYVLKTHPEKNEKGEWYLLQVEDGRPTLTLGEDVYLAAREFRRVIQDGIAAGATFQAATAPESSAAGAEEIPF